MKEPWFDSQTAGMVGAAIGVGLGPGFGGLGGGVGGPLAAAGKARTLVLGAFGLGLSLAVGLAGTSRTG